MSERDSIRSVAILGAGTMGGQIAAHFANAGVPTLLLDVTADVAREGLKRTKGMKPQPFFTRDAASLIRTGGLDSDLSRISEVDWILEAIVERIDVKRALLEQVEATRRGGTIVTTNTSGIPVAAIAAGRSSEFQRHWFGTHFFNPPRYLRLLEIIPTPETDPAVVERVSQFADHRLGKGVVRAKDRPGFIGNHIALYGVAQVLRALESGQFTIEEIDAMTGPALGRPKSATFRTMDIAGIDILAHVARNLVERLADEEQRRQVTLPALVDRLIERGWIGEKAGQGFYKRERSASGSEILTLDPATMTYRSKERVQLTALESVRSIDATGERVKALFQSGDKVGQFLRSTLGRTLVYAARVTPDIAYGIDDVDRVMKWGFGWELGPFEIWDAIGVRQVVDAIASQQERPEELPLVAEVLASGRNRFRGDGVPPAAVDLQILKSAKDRRQIVRQSPGASLVDLGDGVLALEFHSKMNAIGPDTLQMMRGAVKEATSNFAALVIGNDAPDFSAGANLMLLLLEAQEGNWDDIDSMIRAFQDSNRALRDADVPVVAAVAGRTLGGGCEIALHAHRVQAAAESYIGLVEVGVGLIPGGGGTKEMLARAVADLPSENADLLPFVQRVFETIGFAHVSTSALEARQLHYLTDLDRVTMNRERLMADAKAYALELVHEGHQRLTPRSVVVGGETVLAALKLGVHLAWRAGRISEHDATIGRALATVLAGGSLPHRTIVSEQYLLDLEREAFLSLCGQARTLERMQYTLRTGKPLRN